MNQVSPFTRQPRLLARPLARAVLLMLLSSAMVPAQADPCPDVITCLEHHRQHRPLPSDPEVPQPPELTYEPDGPHHVREWIQSAAIHQRRLEEMVLSDNAVTAVYPGALLWVTPLLAGEVTPLRSWKGRPPVTVSLVGADGPEPFTVDGSRAAYERNRAEQTARIEKTAPAVSYRLRTGRSFHATLLDAGFSARYWAFRLGASFVDDRTREQAYAVITLDQKYFDAVVEPSPEGGYAPVPWLESTGEALPFMVRLGEPGIVRRVSYGRRVILAVQADCSEEELYRNLNFEVDTPGVGLSGHVTERMRDFWASMRVDAVILGGNLPPETADLLAGPRRRFLENLNAFLRGSLDYTAATTASPISFEVAYTQDDELVASFETAEYAGRMAGRRLRKEGLLHVTAPVSTDPCHAALIRPDWEVHSDDVTRADLRYALRVRPDRRAVEARIVWNVRECNKHGHPNGTHIRSTRDWYTIWQVPASDPRLIADITRAQAGCRDGHSFLGRCHGFQPFPETAGLRDIRVSFDGNGGNDRSRQRLRATCAFSVWMTREN